MACDVSPVAMFLFSLYFIQLSAGLIITGGPSTSIETFPKKDCAIPPFPQSNLSSFSPFYFPPKREPVTPSLFSTTSWWRVVGLSLAPALPAFLGAVDKMNGLTMQH